MRAVFADTVYWVALVKPDDPWKEPAKRAKHALGRPRMLTTDEVLVEFLNHLSGSGPHLRRQAVRMVRAIADSDDVEVIEQSRASFEAGVNLYEQRLDKDYGLTDCISMSAMEAHEVADVLTHDHHFQQAGFNVLMRQE